MKTTDRPKVTLVGAGPGDPELLTLKALRAIQAATVLLVDDLVSDAIVALAAPDAQIITVGKRGGCLSTPQAFIHKLMVQAALAGQRVVRLKGGDPFIFGRGGEEIEHLRAAGIAVEVVNGITSALAGAASLSIPLTHREHAHGVLFLTGHAKAGDAATDWEQAGRLARDARLTLVIYMGISNLTEILGGLVRQLSPSTAIAVIHNASLPDQRHVVCTLGELLDAPHAHVLRSPSVMIIGDVARGMLSVRAPLRVGNGRDCF